VPGSGHLATGETRVRVRYAETDQMGVAHHSSYILWFEVARTEFVRQLGFTYRELEEAGLFLPVVELQCRFAAPCRYDDQLTIKTRAEAQRARLTFHYEVWREGATAPAAIGSTVHVWIDRRGRPVNPRHSGVDRLERLYDAMGVVDSGPRGDPGPKRQAGA